MCILNFFFCSTLVNISLGHNCEQQKTLFNVQCVFITIPVNAYQKKNASPSIENIPQKRGMKRINVGKKWIKKLLDIKWDELFVDTHWYYTEPWHIVCRAFQYSYSHSHPFRFVIVVAAAVSVVAVGIVQWHVFAWNLFRRKKAQHIERYTYSNSIQQYSITAQCVLLCCGMDQREKIVTRAKKMCLIKRCYSCTHTRRPHSTIYYTQINMMNMNFPIRVSVAIFGGWCASTCRSCFSTLCSRFPYIIIASHIPHNTSNVINEWIHIYIYIPFFRT